MKIIDISLPLSPDTPTWPVSRVVNFHRYKQLEYGDGCKNTSLECDVHAGTHLDAPSHFFKSDVTIENLPLDILIGPAAVAHLPEVSSITAKVLEGLSLTRSTKRLLLRTDHSNFWHADEKNLIIDYIALTPDAAEWVVDRGIRLIGID